LRVEEALGHALITWFEDGGVTDDTQPNWLNELVVEIF